MFAIRRLAATAGILIAAASAAPAGAAEVRLRSLPGGLAAAPVEIGGETLWMLVDTGATSSLLRSAVAERLHLRPRARFVIESTAGAVPGLCAGPVVAWVGGVGLTIDCLGWSEELEEALLLPGVDGVLGADALRGQPVLLDVARGRLVLGATALGAAGKVVPLVLSEGRPAVVLGIPGVGANGGPATLLLVLDSASDTVILFGTAAAAVAARGGEVELETLAGSRRVVRGVAPRLAGLRRQPRQAVLMPELTGRREDGLLPLSVVGAVALDWQRGVAVLGARGRG